MKYEASEPDSFHRTLDAAMAKGRLVSTRDTLAKALAEHGESYDSDCDTYFGCSCGWDNGTDENNAGFDNHLVDALLASGAVVDVATLADDLCKRLCDMEGDPRLFIPSEVRAVLNAALTEPRP